MECIQPDGTCDKLTFAILTEECDRGTPQCDEATLEDITQLCVLCDECNMMDYTVTMDDSMYLECPLIADYVQSIYFLVITMTTVGYGEINPISSYAKIFDCVVMLCTLIVIPQQINDLLDLINKRSHYRTRRYSKSSEDTHIVVSGDITLNAMLDFCMELFHPEHLTMKGQAVVIQNFDPSQNMRHIVEEEFGQKVTYLAGSVLCRKKLLLAETGKAEACVLLANKNSKTALQQDFRNILQALSIKRFVYDKNKGGKEDDNHNIKIVM